MPDPAEDCGICRAPADPSAEILLVIVFAPGLERPYPLIAAEGYRYCKRCDGLLHLARRAIDSHPVTREHAATWTKALVVDVEGKGVVAKMVRSASAAPASC